MLTHEARLRVRYAETDQMGVVYHANYLVWMEVGRVEYCRAAGVRYRDMEQDAGVRLAVVEVGCRFLTPARYDEEVVVATCVEEVNPRMVRFGYTIRHADTCLTPSTEQDLTVHSGHEGCRFRPRRQRQPELLATGFTRHVFLGPDMKPRKLPLEYRPMFGIE
jgi:acyl-CoA thioester hydrolase